MSVDSRPAYGVSGHYLGEEGERYYGWQGGGGMFAGRINRHKFLHLIGPEDTVLDFGCGGGFLLRNIECRRRIGVEINPHALRNAAALGIEAYETLEAVPPTSVDVAVSDHALEHVPYPIAALAQLRRALKPGGLLAICVPSDNWRHQSTYNRDDRNHHLHTWTVQSLGNTLHEAGYEVERIAMRNHAWPGRWTVATYGRLPLWAFDLICRSYSWASGHGRQVFAVARPRPMTASSLEFADESSR